MALTGDPRRPTDIRKYTRKKLAEGDQPPDIMLVVAMVLGLGALLIKVGTGHQVHRHSIHAWKTTCMVGGYEGSRSRAL